MSSDDRLSYAIDGSDRIVSVNNEWAAFAQSNAGTELLPPGILGTSLWTAIQDASTRELYRLILRRVRAGTTDVVFQFRCDSPGHRRLLEMRVERGAEEYVKFSTTTVAREERIAVPLLDATQARSDDLLTVCSWCMCVVLPDETWVDVEQAVAKLELFDAAQLPLVTHGMCPRCFDVMSSAIADTNAAWPPDVILGRLET